MPQIPQKKYKNIYFDLDRTLWDFETNSEKTLFDLLVKYFPEKESEFKKFLSVYYPINEKLWVMYRKGFLKKEVLRIKRFTDSFKQIGITDEVVVKKISEEYISLSPYQTGLFPYTIEILEYLKQAGYKLYLLTNGFKEVQTVKITQSGIDKYIDKMITSDDAGYQKPNRKIFEYALKTVNAKKDESIMVGDDLNTDIAGANSFGMDSIYFNPEQKKREHKATFEIASLKELRNIL